MPAQITFASLGENASELMAGPVAPRPARVPIGAVPSSSPPFAVRSGLAVTVHALIVGGQQVLRGQVERLRIERREPMGGEPLSWYLAVRSKMCCVWPVILFTRRIDRTSPWRTDSPGPPDRE